MRCLVIANENDADPGFVGERLRHHGYGLVGAFRERPYEWPDLAGFDLVLLLGSEWSVYWDAVEPSVRAESALVQAAARRSVPMFGICFGAQMVSHSFGGEVTRAERPEVGWHEIDSTAPDVVGNGPWLQWHYDVFSVPSGFECLATSAVGPQAIRHARVFATQFHPEANESIVERWSRGGGSDELERLGIDAARLVEESLERAAESRQASDRLVDWFVSEVVSS